jgi:ubiquitin-conjugating enzyme E2 J1
MFDAIFRRYRQPNGRFDAGKKICLSISAYHPEEWQPAWGIRLILEALISFLPTEGGDGVAQSEGTRAKARGFLATLSLARFLCFF